MFPPDLILAERSLVNLEQELLAKAPNFSSYNYPASSKSGVVTPVNRELPTQYKPHIRSGNHVKSGFHPRYQWKKLLIVLTAVAALQKGKRKSANGRESKSSGIPSIEDLPLRPLRNLKQRMTAAAKHRSDVPPFVSDEGTPGSANMKAGKSEFLRLTFGPFQSLADPIRLSSEEPNRLAGSEVSKSINAPLLQVFDQQTMQKRRECLFTDAEKEHMSKIRKAGACLECRQRKVKCSIGEVELASPEPPGSEASLFGDLMVEASDSKVRILPEMMLNGN
ncbi:MAG: hypothetical protein Q9179_000499 [Wetmoreana sp. 5 TL-2023]